ncbi:2OG-Fe dioxygenase family protein [Streptomyces sp. 061-3]|uniref:2OG-Fe dioxygenase family protein n=1 Tax=Streptomyces sp. 061-3 TaxID=2789268 RepID=UPI00397FCFB8
MLINREGITRGESQLYDRDRTPIFRTTLLEPLESIVIDDRRSSTASPASPRPPEAPRASAT